MSTQKGKGPIQVEQLDRGRNAGKWVACRSYPPHWLEYVRGKRWTIGSQASKFKTEAAARKAAERIAHLP